MNWVFDLYNSLFGKDRIYVKVDISIDKNGRCMKKRDFKILKAFYTDRRQFNDKTLCLAAKYKDNTYFLSYWGKNRFIRKVSGVNQTAEFELGMRRF
jgi:hypothetical protein